MIPSKVARFLRSDGIPRESGDDPGPVDEVEFIPQYSPRERG